MGNYAGIGWSGTDTTCSSATPRETRLLASPFSHDEPGSAPCARRSRLGVKLVGIDRPDGLLVERLLDAGPRVLPLNPHPSGGHAFAVQGLGAASQIASRRSSSVS